MANELIDINKFIARTQYVYSFHHKAVYSPTTVLLINPFFEYKKLCLNKHSFIAYLRISELKILYYFYI